MVDCPSEKHNRRFPFRPHMRIKKTSEFKRVYSGKLSVADDLLIVYARPNSYGHCRLGLSVGKRLGSAVRRNRIKRMLREAFRLCRHQLPAWFDYVIIPRSDRQLSLGQCRQSLLQLARRLQKRQRKNSTNDK